MEILIMNIPNGAKIERDLLLSLMFTVSNLMRGGTPRISLQNAREVGATVWAAATKVPSTLNEYQRRRLALAILWFLWCHGFREEIYVLFENGGEDSRYEVGDFPEISSLFFPSRK